MADDGQTITFQLKEGVTFHDGTAFNAQSVADWIPDFAETENAYLVAAIASVVMGLACAGDHIVAAAGIFGGTVSLFENTLARFGIKTTLVDVAETSNFANAINKKTKLIFIETIGNPVLDVVDIKGDTIPLLLLLQILLIF